MNRICKMILTATTVIAASCGGPTVPTENVTDAEGVPAITPDYTGIVIPPNIAPMNFEIDIPGEQYIVSVTGDDGKSLVEEGKEIRWNEKKWHTLLEASKGKDIAYELYIRNGNTWKRYKFSNTVAKEEIDPYISYRLIEPSYVQFSAITLNQRDLTSFDESVIFNNASPCDERRGECMNCHVPRNNYRDRASMFHVRAFNPGTVIMAGDSVVKVNLKTDSTISAGVYPAWHPKEDIIAYSTNDTHQGFTEFGKTKVVVYDEASDLILYDMKTHTVSNISNDPDLMETFPSWSPDGRKLYYSVARYPEGTNAKNLGTRCVEVRYDIVSRDFDPKTRKFSNPDTVVSASARGESALLPRVSPDGRYLLFSKSPYGTFHVWQKESDLWVKDLSTGEERPLTHANSDETESYHNWASNGRWIIFSSRRDDGSFTRPYIAYIDADGQDSKAFVVPQESPSFYRELMKSYNVPEFLVAPVEVPRKDIVKQVNAPAKPVKFQ